LTLKFNNHDKTRIVKAISYRFFSSAITFVLAFILTGNMLVSASLGAFDVCLKILTFYYFDKIWNRFTRFESKPAVIWLTGLSGAGKSTIAKQVRADLNRKHVYPVVLDGDEIRAAIRNEGFDEASRKRHNMNVGYIASLFEKQGNIVIVSLISPYSDTRNEVRKLCGNFVEVHVSASLEACISRDPKGLYRRALAGEISDFTGISAPYEPPERPEITIETSSMDIQESSKRILEYLRSRN
jgi:adenylylsulfate kinase